MYKLDTTWPWNGLYHVDYIRDLLKAQCGLQYSWKLHLYNIQITYNSKYCLEKYFVPYKPYMNMLINKSVFKSTQTLDVSVKCPQTLSFVNGDLRPKPPSLSNLYQNAFFCTNLSPGKTMDAGHGLWSLIRVLRRFGISPPPRWICWQ